MVTLDTLRPRLRRLKLSGMLDAIAVRSEEARAGRTDPLDFLLLLLDDELARREAEAVARRIYRARFEDVCDLRDFDFSFNPDIPRARLWDLASGRFIAERKSVLLCGPSGVGKTIVAQALGLEACRQGQRAPLMAGCRYAIADLAGGDWPSRARRAAIALSTGDNRDDDSDGVRLLTDLPGGLRRKGRRPAGEC